MRTGAIRSIRQRPAWVTALVVVVLLSSTGCASIVTPPEAPSDPVIAHVVSGGRHVGLFLPSADGGTVEYGYGEWGWYAQARNSWWRAPMTLLWPHQGALGRRYVSGDEPLVLPQDDRKLEPIIVSGNKVALLIARLDAEFAAGGDPHYNPKREMSLVKQPDHFWILHSCYNEVVEWLRELDSTVSRAPVRRSLTVRSSAAD